MQIAKTIMANHHMFASFSSPLSSWLPRILLAVLSGFFVGDAAWAQPCITCRTERCPTKAGLKLWCETGKEPAASERPSSPRARAERLPILIGSEPPGATVHLGSPQGTALGKTPIRDAVLAPGRYRLWLILPGYQAAALDVAVEAHGPRQFYASLEPLVPLGQAPTAQPKAAAGAATAQRRNPPPAQPAVPTGLLPPAVAAAIPAAQVPAGPSPLMVSTSAKSPSYSAGSTEVKPIYKRPWFWGVMTAVGAVTVGGIVAGVVVGTRGSGVPDNIEIQPFVLRGP